MDTFENLRTFITVVKEGSFSAAARNLGAVPSVIMKRINRLEDEVGSPLFERSTRKLELTETGGRLLPRAISLVTEVNDTFSDLREARTRMKGSIRVKCPTTLGVRFLTPVFASFLDAHPQCRMELVLLDRSVNPAEEGFDIALGAMPTSFASVAEYPLAAYPRKMVASPQYLECHPVIRDPRDLERHSCLVFQTMGTLWSFTGASAPMTVSVNARLTSNDSLTLIDCATKGLGITIASSYLVQPDLDNGNLTELLPDWKPARLWVKGLVPESKRKNPLIQAFIEWLRDAMEPKAPWILDDTIDEGLRQR